MDIREIVFALLGRIVHILRIGIQHYALEAKPILRALQFADTAHAKLIPHLISDMVEPYIKGRCCSIGQLPASTRTAALDAKMLVLIRIVQAAINNCAARLASMRHA